MNTENVSLHYQDQRSDKVYHLQVEQHGGGWVVNFQFGRRGSTLQSGSKTPKPVTREKAVEIRDRILRDKTGKGYKVNGAAQAAPVAPAEPSRRTDYPAELLTEIGEDQAAALLRDSRYWLQEKRNGQRRQVAKRDGQLVGYNRKGTAVPLPATLEQQLRGLKAERFVLDGESEGDNFVVFDLLECDDEVGPDTPYSERFAILTRLLKGLESAQPVATWTGKHKAQAAQDLGDIRAEGLVFKLASASYAAGRNGQHYKYKFVKTCSAKVLRVGDKGKQSVAVGLLEKGKWVDVGTVSTIGKAAAQVEDVLEIRYLYATEARRLYQAIYIGKRDDVDTSECSISQLIFKQGV